MSSLLKSTLLFLTLALVCPDNASGQNTVTSKFKCMIQLTNYAGEKAYMVVSIINPKNGYDKTLYVMGSDKKWYNSLKEWHKAFSKRPANISAVTGASVTGGDRSVNVFEIETAKINAGYKLRFESAVEDKDYFVKDLEIPLTTEALAAKSEGTGYIRYVRFSPN